MNKRILFRISLTLLLLSSLTVWAQGPPMQVTGQILDQLTEEPVPYATVVVFKSTDKEMLSGTTTDEEGRFNVRCRNTRVDVTLSFIGYLTDTIQDLIASNGLIDLGVLHLKENSQLLDEVVVQGEVSRTTFELDKRVFNVGKDLSSSGASALEVLNNVPSVNVNIEGEVSLRGSTGVQILIDGKPSILADDASNALGTITAEMIESVEVITNPSAKYDAEGTSGILNIVLKKDERKGLNGSISFNTGTPDNHSVGLSVNRRTQKFNLFAQGGIGYRSLPRFSESVNEDKITAVTVRSNTDAYRNETFYNFTLGTDYHINKLNVLTLSGRFAFEQEDNPSRSEFMTAGATPEENGQWIREEETEATNPKWQFDLQYKREFKDDKDHTLIMSGQGSFFGKDQSSVFSNTVLSGNSLSGDQKTATDFLRADYILKMDYTDPLSDEVSIETGVQYEFNDIGNDYSVRDEVDGEFLINSDLTNDFNYDQEVFAAYGTASYEGKKAGLKVGLRMENTVLNTLLVTTDVKSEQDYTNLFPSAHTSYKLSERFSLQAGYSRRIRRPRLWDLNPFFNISNNFNVRVGNPALLPEFTDSYELTSILILEDISLNGSIYHRYTTDVMERVSLFEDNVNTTIPMNIGTVATTGFELNGKYSPAKWLTLNGDFNFSTFDRKGDFEGSSFDFTGEKWTARLTSKFTLPKGIDFEMTGNYRSGYETVQGDISDMSFMDLGLRKKLLKGKIMANLGVRDLFASRVFENIIDQDDFYLSSISQRGRFITFGVSYGFGKGEAMSYGGGKRRR